MKSSIPSRLFFVHKHGRRFIVLYTNMAALTSCENDLLVANYLTGWSNGIRGGPLEKLWGGGGGEFSSRRNFFLLYIKFLVWIFFRSLHKYFLGLIGVQEIFLIKFSLARIFFLVLRSPPHKFSNGPSLNRYIWHYLSDNVHYLNWSLVY